MVHFVHTSIKSVRALLLLLLLCRFVGATADCVKPATTSDNCVVLLLQYRSTRGLHLRNSFRQISRRPNVANAMAESDFRRFTWPGGRLLLVTIGNSMDMGHGTLGWISSTVSLLALRSLGLLVPQEMTFAFLGEAVIPPGLHSAYTATRLFCAERIFERKLLVWPQLGYFAEGRE